MPATTTDIQTYLDAFGGDVAAATKALEAFSANTQRRTVRQQRPPGGGMAIPPGRGQRQAEDDHLHARLLARFLAASARNRASTTSSST